MSDSEMPWTVACQVPLSTGVFRQEYWSGLPFPSLGDLPRPGIGSIFLALSDEFFTIEPPEKQFNSSGYLFLKFFMCVHSKF